MYVCMYVCIFIHLHIYTASFSYLLQLVDTEEEHNVSSDKDSSKASDAEGDSSLAITLPSTSEGKSPEPQGNHIAANVVSSVDTPVRETQQDVVNSRERTESSPKTLRELSKEVSKIANALNIENPDNVPVDEGIDMKGTEQLVFITIVFLAIKGSYQSYFTAVVVQL